MWQVIYISIGCNNIIILVVKGMTLFLFKYSNKIEEKKGIW